MLKLTKIHVFQNVIAVYISLFFILCFNNLFSPHKLIWDQLFKTNDVVS